MHAMSQAHLRHGSGAAVFDAELVQPVMVVIGHVQPGIPTCAVPGVPMSKTLHGYSLFPHWSCTAMGAAKRLSFVMLIPVAVVLNDLTGTSHGPVRPPNPLHQRHHLSLLRTSNACNCDCLRYWLLAGVRIHTAPATIHRRVALGGSQGGDQRGGLKCMAPGTVRRLDFCAVNTSCWGAERRTGTSPESVHPPDTLHKTASPAVLPGTSCT